MWQTLFYLPERIGPWPLFGWGWAVAGLLLGGAIYAWFRSRTPEGRAEIGANAPIFAIICAAVVYVVPNLVEQGAGLPIRGFGVMLLAAVAAAIALAVRRSRQMGIDPELIYSLAFWLFAAGIAGARIFYVIEYRHEFIRDSWRETLTAIVNVPQGGIVIYGALIGGGIALFAYCRFHRLPALALADLIAPSVVLGASLGRIGCFLNGCCFGGLCDSAQLAVHFPPNAAPYARHWELGWLHGLQMHETQDGLRVDRVLPESAAEKAGIKIGATIVAIDGAPAAPLADLKRRFTEEYHAFMLSDGRSESSTVRLLMADGTEKRLQFTPPARSRGIHAAQIYDAVNLALLCAVLWFHYPMRRRDGETFALLLTLYPISRFIMEIIRVDEPSQFGTTLSISQLISIGILSLAVVVWITIEACRRPLALPMSA